MNTIEEKNNAKILAKNLKRLLYKRGKTQVDVIRDLGIKQSTISSWMTGDRLPRMDKLDMLCAYLKCNRSELMEEYTGETRDYDAVKIPILGKVAAGKSIEMIEDVLGDVTINRPNGAQYFALEIKGDSMLPRIEDGDIVIVRKQDDIESGELAIVSINGDDATCKRLKKYRDGIELISLNPSYGTRFFSNEEIESKPVTIIGKVVELRAKF